MSAKLYNANPFLYLLEKYKKQNRNYMRIIFNEFLQDGFTFKSPLLKGAITEKVDYLSQNINFGSARKSEITFLRHMLIRFVFKYKKIMW